VDEYTQALLLLNGVFDAISLGVRRIYIYELLDEKADPQFKIPNLHWGIYKFGGGPKVAATALHNLTRILAPERVAGEAASVLPQASGLPATARRLVLQKGPTTTLVILWNEPDIWDQTASKPLKVSAAEVAVSFPAAQQIRIFDPLSSDQPTQVLGPGSSANVRLGAFPQIVEIMA
jgi:hypothetical protein